MSDFKNVLDFGKDILTLGGHSRLDFAKERLQACAKAYERLAHSVDISNQEIDHAINRLKRAFVQTKRVLLRAERMLEPLARSLPNNSYAATPQPSFSYSPSIHARDAERTNSSALVMKGAAVGTSAAIAAWQGAQIVGVASTGTAMLGLHGAAASNAGWALFGGGSLATGGGGMALGHLVLPGVGLAVGIGFMAVTTHKKANELNRESQKIEAEINEGETALVMLNQSLLKLRQSEDTYDVANERLTASVQVARRRLRRFWILSDWFRLLRFKWNGVYYTARERGWAQELDAEVKAFFSAVGFQRV